MKRIISTLFAILLFSNITFSQTEQTNDSTNLEQQTIANLDSLLNSYYIKRSLKRYHTQNNNVFTENHDVNISDSVIIERLKKIATPIRLSYNAEVRRWINLYLKRGKYMIPTFLGLSNYYFPMFENELAAKGLPLELKYLPIIESALNPRAVSRAGATGIWQFMYGTGKRYGLEINSYVDERRDPMKATKAAVSYLKDLYGIFHNWNLALAAYNCGAANVKKAIIRSGGKTDFWDLYPYLPRETRGYIPAFVAMTYIMNYANDHNFYPAKIDLPLNTDTVMISDTLHLRQVSAVINIPMDQLRDLNPQYKIDVIPGYIRPYPLRLPMNKISAFLLNEDKIYKYKDSLISSERFLVKEPPRYRSYYYRRHHRYYYRPCPKYNLRGKGKIYYSIKSGDTFSFIAEWFDVSVRDIKCWNKIRSNRIKVGQKLVIYEPMKKLAYYNRLNGMSFDQKQNLASNRTARRRSLDQNYVYYTIKHGDNLYTIAKKFSNVSYQDLVRINNFSHNDVAHLQIGQVIKIKKKN
jgi:membrane-bound lytic murein transglycosylase D